MFSLFLQHFSVSYIRVYAYNGKHKILIQGGQYGRSVKFILLFILPTLWSLLHKDVMLLLRRQVKNSGSVIFMVVLIPTKHFSILLKKYIILCPHTSCRSWEHGGTIFLWLYRIIIKTFKLFVRIYCLRKF